MKSSITKTMLINFVIWLVPVAIILALSVIVIVLLMGAAADPGSSSSSKKDPFEKWPKGLIGSLGIGYGLATLGALSLFFFFSDIDAEGIVSIVGLAVVCSLLSFWGIKYDYKRLKKLYS